jgi:hypothetical protein
MVTDMGGHNSSQHLRDHIAVDVHIYQCLIYGVMRIASCTDGLVMQTSYDQASTAG